jgi:hypothetical protein
MSSCQVGDKVSMGQFHTPDSSSIPKEVFRSCKNSQPLEDIAHKTLVLIENTLLEEASRLEELISHIKPMKKRELELMAQIIVSKALDEVQHAKACVSLSCALDALLPALPSAHRRKSESFMHALLDVFQTEFEKLFAASSTAQRNENRIRAIVQFAGHLYCHRLLGNGVVSQIVQDLIDNGESAFANELLWSIGAVTNTDYGNLTTVVEDADSDGASSESIGASRRRPPLPMN